MKTRAGVLRRPFLSLTVYVLAYDGLHEALLHQPDQRHVAKGGHSVVPAPLVLGQRLPLLLQRPNSTLASKVRYACRGVMQRHRQR